MNDRPLHSTLREWRDHMARPTALGVCAGVAAILTLISPFDMEDILGPVQRFIYWVVVVTTTYSIGFIINGLLRAHVPLASQRTRRVILSGLATGAGVVLMVGLINWIAFSFVPRGADLAFFLGNTFAIAFIVAFIFNVVLDTDTSDAKPPALLDRLPFDKRGPLVSLSVEDHYVHIRTIKGEHMILLRLADAIREVGDTQGLQVHRSHWIALNQVTAATRKGDGAVLSMTHGDDIPVSRANVAKIREAGLLPKTNNG